MRSLHGLENNVHSFTALLSAQMDECGESKHGILFEKLIFMAVIPKSFFKPPNVIRSLDLFVFATQRVGRVTLCVV